MNDFDSWDEVKDCLAFTIFIGWPVGLIFMFGITILRMIGSGNVTFFP